MAATPEAMNPAQNRAPPHSRGFWPGVGRRLREDAVTMSVLAVLATIIGAAVFAPWVTSYSPFEASEAGRLLPVNTPNHWLGTDDAGRDLYTRLVYGARISLLSGVLPVFVATLIGASLGLFAGLVGGRTNAVIMRVADVFYAFPSVLLAIVIVGVLGAGLPSTLLSLSVVFIPPMLRVAEGVAAEISVLDYVAAARASGTSELQVLWHHVIPNAAPSILAYGTSLVSVSVILSSGLSFLGLGVAPPTPDWGLTLNALRQAIYEQPLLATLPGLLIFITSMCFNLAADGLRNAMDTRMIR